MAKQGNRVGILGGITESYLRDFAKASGRFMGTSDVVRGAMTTYLSVGVLKELQQKGRPGIKVIASGVTARLLSDGKISRDQAENLQAAMEEFFQELVVHLPKDGNPKTNAYFERQKAALRASIRNLRNRFIPGEAVGDRASAPPTSVTDAGSVISDRVFTDICAMLEGDDAKIRKMMRRRTAVLTALYSLSMSADPRCDDAQVAFNFGYFGNAASTGLLLGGLSLARSKNEMVNMAIATILSLTEKDYALVRRTAQFDRVLSGIADAGLDLAVQAPERMERQGVPVAKFAATAAGEMFVVSWIVIVLSILGWLFCLYRESLTAALVFSIVNMVALLTINVIPIQIVGGAMSTVDKVLHFAHLIAAQTLSVPGPARRMMRNPQDMSQLIPTDAYVKVTRWRAMIAPMGSQLLVYPLWILIWNKGEMAWDTIPTYALHVILLGIVIGVMLKFEGMTPGPSGIDAREYYRLSRRGLTVLMIGALGAILLAKISGVATSTPLTYATLSSAELGRNTLRHTMLQGVLLSMVLVAVTGFAATVWSLVKEREGGLRVLGTAALTLMLVIAYQGQLDASPLGPALDPMDRWSELGLEDPITNGLIPDRDARNSGNGTGRGAPMTTQEAYEARREERERARDRRRQRRRNR
ncbi:hypothetical protein HOI83_00395 [Candidatus Uhrbacteria bacterium]|jgi:hypothetical protein|nr:hypothetical protein [Candidatus Uhrbacteria bacterium]